MSITSAKLGTLLAIASVSEARVPIRAKALPAVAYVIDETTIGAVRSYWVLGAGRVPVDVGGVPPPRWPRRKIRTGGGGGWWV
jgi:hypothetical protein